MENRKDCEQDLDEEGQFDVGTIFRNIYFSCDADNTDSVAVSKIIEFIRPFMLEDLNALEGLRSSLDPENRDIHISSERFYEVIGEWSKKIAGGSIKDEEFRPSSHLVPIEDIHLPYSHSTPRASLGDKLLKCKGLMDLSNISGYSLSTSKLDTTNPGDAEKTELEEQIRRLEHQILKLTDELSITKQQLSSSEEQNDILQQNLEKINKRLNIEQQVIEHLQRDKKDTEELQEEVNCLKEIVESLKRQLSQSEKDTQYFKRQITELEDEKVALDRKNEQLLRQHRDCLKEIVDIKSELKIKEEQNAVDNKICDEMKENIRQQRDIIDQLKQEIDDLNLNKNTLEKSLKSKAGFYSNLGNCSIVSGSAITPVRENNSSLNGSNLALQNRLYKSPSGIRKFVLIKNTSTPQDLSKSPEVLSSSPVLLSSIEVEQDSQNNSSEEDLQWKMGLGEPKSDDESQNGKLESLCCEMNKVDSLMMTKSYNTVLFEKDEYIITLEEQVDLLRDELEKREDYRLDQKRITTGLETNGVIVECEHETVESEDNADLIKEMEETIKNKEKEIQQLKKELENTNSKYKEVADIYEQNAFFKETLNTLSEQKQTYDETLNELKEKNQSLQNDLDLKDGEVELLKAAAENERKIFVDELGKQIAKNEYEFQKKIDEKESEIQEIKNNLEKKIVGEFEGKVRHSVDAEETILKLNHRCNQQEQKIDLLESKNSALHSEIDNLQVAISQLESQQVEKFDSTLAEIEKHLAYKNLVIEELKSLNETMKIKLGNAETDLRKKIGDILCLRDSLSKDIEVNNKLWKEMQGLKNELTCLNEEHTKLFEQHNNLLIVHDIEVKKHIQELAKIDAKLREETERNRQLEDRLESMNQLTRNDSACQTESVEEANRILTELEEKLMQEIENNSHITKQLNQTNFELAIIKKKVNELELETERKLEMFTSENKQLSDEILKAQEKINISQCEKEKVHQKLLDEIETNNELNNNYSLKCAELESSTEKNSEMLRKLCDADKMVKCIEQELECTDKKYRQALKDSKDLTEKLTEHTDRIAALQQENSKLSQEVINLSLYRNANQKFQLELEKNQVLFNKLQQLKDEKDALISDLKEMETLYSTCQVVSNNREIEFKKLQAECALFQETIARQTEQMNQSELLLQQNKKELKIAIFERDILNKELAHVKAVITQMTDREQELIETKEELQDMVENNKALLEELDEVRRKSLNSSASSDRDYGKPKTYNRQQITIDRLKDRLESLEGELKNEKTKTHELKTKLSLAESQKLCWGVDFEMVGGTREWKSSNASPHVSEGRTVNKFTLCSSKFQVNRPNNCPDVVVSEVVIEVPSLDISTLANVFQDIDLSQESSRKTLNKEEIEKKVENLVSVIRINSNDLCERIEKHTETYRIQYEGILTLLGDISQRLRDHVCIGTAEPIMPVFVLLEDIKIQLKQLVENVSQVGALIYEEKMKRFWNLVADYVISVRQADESCSVLNESTSRKIDVRRRKSRLRHGKSELNVKSPQKKKRNIPKMKIAVLFLFLATVFLVGLLMVHINCRMTVADSQYCPLDGLITQVNEGLPPM